QCKTQSSALARGILSRFVTQGGFSTKLKAAAPFVLALLALLLGSLPAQASEADLAIPDLHEAKFTIFGQEISPWNLLFYGALVICGTLGISLYQFWEIKKQPAHRSMLNIAEIIFQTCKTYLIQQGKFLLLLFVIIASAMTYYFVGLQHK